MWLGQCFAKETLRCRSVPFGRQQEVDRLAAFVDRPVEVGPPALHLYIGLVHTPRAVVHSQMRPDLLLQFDGICLNPAEDRRVIHRHTAVEKHQFEVTIADGEHQIPPDRPQDHLRGELPPLERLTCDHRRPA